MKIKQIIVDKTEIIAFSNGWVFRRSNSFHVWEPLWNNKNGYKITKDMKKINEKELEKLYIKEIK